MTGVVPSGSVAGVPRKNVNVYVVSACQTADVVWYMVPEPSLTRVWSGTEVRPGRPSAPGVYWLAVGEYIPKPGLPEQIQAVGQPFVSVSRDGSVNRVLISIGFAKTAPGAKNVAKKTARQAYRDEAPRCKWLRSVKLNPLTTRVSRRPLTGTITRRYCHPNVLVGVLIRMFTPYSATWSARV
jgi:hypothetical protein